VSDCGDRATTTVALWSARGDLRMFGLMLTGRIERELRRLGL